MEKARVPISAIPSCKSRHISGSLAELPLLKKKTPSFSFLIIQKPLYFSDLVKKIMETRQVADLGHKAELSSTARPYHHHKGIQEHYSPHHKGNEITLRCPCDHSGLSRVVTELCSSYFQTKTGWGGSIISAFLKMLFPISCCTYEI